MLMRWDPFRDMDRVAQMLTQQSGAQLRQATVPMDAYREGDRFVVRFDLPGVDPGSIDITTEHNVLTINAERSWQPDEGQQVVALERPQGTFSRQLFLGDNLDVDAVQASFDQGVLTLTIPVAEQAKPRKIEVKPGSGAAQSIGTTSGSGSSG